MFVCDLIGLSLIELVTVFPGAEALAAGVVVITRFTAGEEPVRAITFLFMRILFIFQLHNSLPPHASFADYL